MRAYFRETQAIVLFAQDETFTSYGGEAAPYLTGHVLPLP
jgi:hypothetical protein